MSSPYDGSLVTRPKLLAIFVIGIVGGLLVLGGLAAITNVRFLPRFVAFLELPRDAGLGTGNHHQYIFRL